MSGVAGTPKNELDKGARESENVLIQMRDEGKEIQQEQSYVAGDSIFCVYNAESEDLIHEHAKRSESVVTEVTEVSSVIKHNTSVVS